jgi:hypothetical protein
MELESQNGHSGAVFILDATAADPRSHQRFLCAGAAALLALGALSIPIHASATTTVFATVPAESITAAPAGFSGRYLVSDVTSAVYSIGTSGGTPTLPANPSFSPFAGATLGNYYGGLSGQYLAAGSQFPSREGDLAAISGTGTVTPLLAAAGGQFGSIVESTAPAPEIDPASAAGALTLLLGTLAVLRSGRVL